MNLVVLPWIALSFAMPALAADDPFEDGKKLSEKVVANWKGCLAANVDRYSQSDEQASTVADVAFTKCSDWDVAVKKVSGHRIAVLMMGKMPFNQALQLAEDDADNTLAEMKAKLKPTLVARVIDNRLDRGKSR